MKKTLALILAVLVAFSMFTVATFAEDAEAKSTVTVTFVNNDATYAVVDIIPGTPITAYTPADPTRASDVDAEGNVTKEYIFKGWSTAGSDELYYRNTIPAPTADITYVAVYSEKEVGETQTFWSFIQSIFARINLLFQYFAEIFSFDD